MWSSDKLPLGLRTQMIRMPIMVDQEKLYHHRVPRKASRDQDRWIPSLSVKQYNKYYDYLPEIWKLW